MHVCLFDASALFGRLTSPNRQTHTRANLSVCASPPVPSECASLGGGVREEGGGKMGRGKGGERGRDRAA